MSLWVDGFLSGWVGELMSSGVAGHLCIGKPLSWLVLYSARFVETLKVKATSLYNTRARERWARSLLLSFSAAPFCLISNTIFPYSPRRFTLSPTPFYLIRHTILPYPPRHFCLIRHAILPYLQHHFALSPTSFHLIPKAIFSPFHPLFNHR